MCEGERVRVNEAARGQERGRDGGGQASAQGLGEGK